MAHGAVPADWTDMSAEIEGEDTTHGEDLAKDVLRLRPTTHAPSCLQIQQRPAAPSRKRPNTSQPVIPVRGQRLCNAHRKPQQWLAQNNGNAGRAGPQPALADQPFRDTPRLSSAATGTSLATGVARPRI